MSQSLYDQLRSMTVVVTDTGDIKSIEQFAPCDATTNPSLITAAAQMDDYRDVVDAALRRSREEIGEHAREVVGRAIDRLAVEFGVRILGIISGRVSTEVDARLSHETEATVDKARRLIGYYEEAGIARDRVLIKIASTWEGIRAAERLEAEGIHCNLTLLFGLHQAAACADAGVTLISPFVGRIMDWYKLNQGRDRYAPRRGSRSAVRHTHLQLLQALRVQDRDHGRELPQPGRDLRAGRVRSAHHCARSSSALCRPPRAIYPVSSPRRPRPRSRSTSSTSTRRRSSACTPRTGWRPKS